MASESPRNRLAREASPYLRQHASNPVDWYPWGEEAFDRAKAEDKPIFLSVGYSTCHWCHVMAHESFENEAIAAQLNRGFVSVKVDREERPDVDRVYMTFVQASTGSGGWPMSVWLTPDLLPFYGGTYFPPEDRWGRPGFGSMLNALERVWHNDRANVFKQATHAVQVLRQFSASSGNGAASELDYDAAVRLLSWCWESLDEQWGGFGGAPKFPRPVLLEFLWRMSAAAAKRGQAEQAEAAKRCAVITLQHMVAGGMHDHLGGGFHRYSVDARWHVPHFEKMLYDQGQLVVALLEGWQISGQTALRTAAHDALRYVLRDMTSPEGGFYAAEDADSLRRAGGTEHAEGAFYVWSADEIQEILGPDRAREFSAHYGVEPNGNAPEGSDPHGEFTGLNILVRRTPNAAPDIEQSLAQSRVELFAVRENRPRPHRDEKILAAWNGLMISAFARAARVEGSRDYATAAERAAEFIRNRLWESTTGILRRSVYGERPGPEGYAEDYACLIQGLLDLYEATFAIGWLQWAVELQTAQDRWFGDEAGAGYFSSSGRDASVLVRMKEDHDGAEPAPSSVAVRNLLRLGRMLNSSPWLARAESTLRGFAAMWQRSPQGLPAMMSGLLDWLQPPCQVVIAGDPASMEFDQLAREAGKRFLPGVVLLAADGGAGQSWLAERASAIRDMRPVDDRPAAYVCESFTCQLPVTEPAALGRALDQWTAAKP